MLIIKHKGLSLRSMKKNIATFILLSCTSFFIPAGAQNNPYKIDDSLYSIFQRATRWRSQPEGLLIADTLYAEATRKNDKKAQCLALTIPTYYYSNTNQYDQLEQAVERAKEEARRNNYLQYYYAADTQIINWLLNHGHSLRALQKTEEMKAQAFKDQHAYGIFTCIRTLGHIYYIRRDPDSAAEYYKNALDYMLEHLPEQDPSSLYLNLSEYHRNKKDYQTALEYSEKGIKEAKVEENRQAAMLDKCMVLFEMDDTKAFNDYFEVCRQHIKRHGSLRRSAYQNLKVYKFILDGDYNRALAAADSLQNISAVNQLHYAIYQKAGNYRKALEYGKWIYNYQDSVNRLIQSTDLAELNAQIGNERIKLEAKALEFKNAELILKEQQITARHHIVTLSLVLSFLFLSTSLLIFYLYRRRKTMAVLQEKNQELTIARDRAEQADKMKMFFIQNMSHEIRTPLNAIVGFSQVLSTPGMEVDEEEKEEFSMLIQQNSELLTTLVNDVLELANLESGKYTMHLSPHPCNELCRVALASVVRRNPEKVRLYFTSDAADDFQFVTDKERLQQVLINFLTNAEKHTVEGEIHLHCSLTENPGKVTFSVTDTGPGVPEDQAEQIFERFNKLDEFKQGTGLGLNICSIIAERLGGEVKLDKSYTGGARFLFILPNK